MSQDTKREFVPEGVDEYTYNADGTVATITRTSLTETWLRTYTYTSGNMTNDSGWVKQ